MRSFVLALALMAFASALEINPITSYHESVGIPLAAKIKEHEEKIIVQRTSAFNEARIIGGVLAPANAHPFFAGLLIDLVNLAGQSVCGATLLSTNRLVTAAHCWFDTRNQARQFNVILGTQFLYSGGTRISTTTVITHPQYVPSNLRNDIAMIYLPSQVTLSARIMPAQLPSSAEVTQTFVGQWANAVGFGRTSDSQVSAATILSHVDLQVISEAQCRVIYGAGWVFDSTLCTNGAGSVGVCGGDSGGPLVLQTGGRNILIGISSFAAEGACAGGWPSGFARVTSFVNFVNQHLW